MATRPILPPATGTLADTTEQQPDLRPVRPTAAPLEPPKPEQPWGEFLTQGWTGENLHAGRVMMRSDRSDFGNIRIHDGYAPIVQALGLEAGDNPFYFPETPRVGLPLLTTHYSRLKRQRGGGSYFSSFADRAEQEQLIAGMIRERRLKDPKFLPGVPDTVEGLRRRFLQDEKAKRDQARKTLDNSTGLGATVSSFAGGLIEAFHDPVNLATLPVGGGGKTVLQVFAREALINGAIELATQPIVAGNREQLGEELTGAEALLNVGTAAAGGGILGSAMHVAGKGVAAVVQSAPVREAADKLADTLFAAMPERLQKQWGKAIVKNWGERLANGEKLEDVFSELSNRELTTLSRAVIGEDKLTPDERAAMNVLERAQEIGEASPFEATPEGDAAHESGLAAAIQRIEDGLPPEDVPAASVEPARPRGSSTAPRPQGPARLPIEIVDGLKARGIPEHIARGAAAGAFAESRANPRISNPTSGAFGIGQWLGSRKAELFRRYGASPSLEQQLDFLAWELKGGDHGGASVLAAKDEVEALNAYIRDFMRPAAGAETTGDLERGMAALGRGGEALPAGSSSAADIGADPEIARLRAEAAALEDEISGMVPVPGAGDVPITRRRILASDVLVDAGRFQFKSGGDSEGVIETLRGVKRWDPLAAGTLTFWQDGEGRVFVADGHQRSGLARRIQEETGQEIWLDGHVLREADGVSSEMARAIAALNNIRNGSTSRVDAAKVLRDLGFEADLNLPPKSALARDAEGLARLSDPAFGAVVNEHISPEIAAVVGRLLPDKPELHEGMIGLLMKLDPPRPGQAESIVRQAVAAGMHSEEQINLFGSSELTRSLFLEKAKIVERATGELRKMRVVHNTAARNAGELERTGSRIAREQSAKEAQRNAETASLIEKLYTRGGPIADALDAAARDLAGGGKQSDVVARFIADVAKLDLDTLARGADSGDRGLELPDRSGSTVEAGAALEDVSGEPGLFGLEEPTAADLAAATERFSDPDGEAVRQQADSLEHDLRAELAAKAPTDAVLHGDKTAPFEADFERLGIPDSVRVAIRDKSPEGYDVAQFIADWEKHGEWMKLRDANDALFRGGLEAQPHLGRQDLDLVMFGQRDAGAIAQQYGEGERRKLVKAMHARAVDNQAELVTIGEQLGREIGIELANPGVKSLDRALEKLADYGNVGDIKDLARIGFLVTDRGQGDKILETLGRRFAVHDKGWKDLDGYKDRKLIVRLDNGDVAEVQIIPKVIADYKFGAGHALYERARDPATPAAEFEAIVRQMKANYERLLEGTDFAAVGKADANASAVSSDPSSIADRTVATDALRQAPESNTNPLSGSSTATGLSSSSNSRIAGAPFSPENMGANGRVDKFRLDEEGDEISPAELLAELDADDAAIKAMRECL